MSILFMMPEWEDAYKGWMQRMMLCISEKMTAIAVNDSQGSATWQGVVPVISLTPPGKEIRYFSHLFALFGLSLTTRLPEAQIILKRTISAPPVGQVLCQYGTYAVKFMQVWQETDVPLYIHFHGYDATFDLRTSDRPERRRFSSDYLENLLILSQRAVLIANSRFTKSLLVQAGFPSNKVVVKYLGVPIPEKKRHHTPVKEIRILHVGRLVDFKSPDRTIKAFEIARSRGMDGCLTVAGDGPMRATCELLRLRSPFRDSIHLLGEVDSMHAQNLIFESDIFTQHNVVGEITRQSECLGVSVLEAMAAGLPVVGTRSGGVLETMVDGETGILVEPGDVEAQADAFIRLSQDHTLRQQMGDAGRARVSSLFSQQREARRLREIMNLPQLAS